MCEIEVFHMECEGKDSVRIYLPEAFSEALNAKIAEMAPEFSAAFRHFFPGDRPGFRVTQYHVPTDVTEGFKNAVVRVTNNVQHLQHNQL